MCPINKQPVADLRCSNNSPFPASHELSTWHAAGSNTQQMPALRIAQRLYLCNGQYSVQEEEAKLKPGTDKHIAFQCLKDAGAGGLNITQIIDAAKQNGVKDLDENSKRVIQYVSDACLPALP